jgi:hypothetical protein
VLGAEVGRVNRGYEDAEPGGNVVLEHQEPEKDHEHADEWRRDDRETKVLEQPADGSPSLRTETRKYSASQSHSRIEGNRRLEEMLKDRT